jgi:opacity protein-like surface antigen
MMKRHWLKVARVSSLMLLVLGAVTTPASAQVVQVTRADARHSIGFNLGYFMLRAEDARDDDDVLLANQVDFGGLELRERPGEVFKVSDFNHVTFGAEWLYAVTDYIETGASIGFYQKSIDTEYKDQVNANGNEITQSLKLRIFTPLSATVRFLPVGRSTAVEPYVGGGIALLNWRYSEIGDFIDGNNDIFPARLIDSGTKVGPVLLGGVRFPVGDAMTAGGEFRWQNAKADLEPTVGFLTETLDLGGWSVNFNMHFRF